MGIYFMSGTNSVCVLGETEENVGRAYRIVLIKGGVYFIVEFDQTS